MLGSRTENKMMQIKELSGLNADHGLVGVMPFIRFMPFFSDDGSDNDSAGSSVMFCLLWKLGCFLIFLMMECWKPMTRIFLGKGPSLPFA